MKPGKACILFILLVFAGSKCFSQNIRLYASPKGADVLDANNDTMLNPWCGGWSNPQFSNIDLNGDGRPDLFVFEPGSADLNSNPDDKILTFLNIGNGQYQYYPEYESYFPPLQYWALLVDYNHDGKADIFTYSAGGSGIDVYKNISDKNGLKFKKVTFSTNVNKDLVCYTDKWKDTFNIFVSYNTIPVIADLDGDGDVDIISFDPAFLTAYYYKNMTVENGYNADSIHFAFTNPTTCWGKFQTTYSVASPVKIGGAFIGCGQSMKRNLHGASSMLAVDMDNDGDMDLLYGNLYGNQITQMTNGRIQNGKVKLKTDSIISADSGIFGSHKINVSVYPAAYLVEATGDTLNDIVIAPMDGANDTPNHKTFLYRNTGNQVPGNHFQLVTDNFLQETMLDYGEHAAPAFVDFNGDGLMDLVIATRSNLYGGYSSDHLMLYENIGTAKKAVYKKVDDDFASMKKYNLAYLSPTFADLDGDGRPDMLVGTAGGNVMYFKNVADSGGSLKMKLISNIFSNVQGGSYSTPCFAHISSDTVFDIVMGTNAGTFLYYKNIGNSKSPVFNLVTSNFGGVRTNLYYWVPTKYDAHGNVIDSMQKMQSSGRSSPVIGDFDHDGKLDMVSGSSFGEMFFYFDITDNLNGKFTRTDTVFYNTLKNAKENKNLGLITMPAAADINGDGYPELLVGNNMGGIFFYGSQKVKLGIDNNLLTSPFSNAEFDVFPNPAHQSINVTINDNIGGSSNLSISNILGESVYNKKITGDESISKLDVSGLKPGFYFVRLTDDSGRSGVRKIIIQ